MLYYIKASEFKVKFPRRTIAELRGNFQDKEVLRNQRIESFLRGNTKESDFINENYELNLSAVLKYLNKESRYKAVSKLRRRRSEDVAGDDLNNLSDTELHRIKKLAVAGSRSMKNIAIERNRKYFYSIHQRLTGIIISKGLIKQSPTTTQP